MSLPDSLIPRYGGHTPWWLLTLTLLIGVWLVFLFKLAGGLLALGLLVLVVLASRRPDVVELDALLTSISLSAQDISDVLDEFDQFCTAPDAQHLEDRTLLRPALLDRDSSISEIAQFHEDAAAAQRFLHRLPARIAAPLTRRQAENLLRITDERAELVRTSWTEARRAARQHGAN